MDAKIAVAPGPVTDADQRNGSMLAPIYRDQVLDAVRNNGGELVPIDKANGLIWLSVVNVAELIEVLDANPNIEWVQLPWAGVDAFLTTDLFARSARFTCAKGAYAEEVAEHALALTLASLRPFVEQARTPTWLEREPTTLFRKRITIVGGGGIASVFTQLVAPFDCHVTVLRRSNEPLKGADETLTIDKLPEVLPDTDVLLLALSLTDKSRGIIGAAELALLPAGAVIVNVARGAHIDTDALVATLRAGKLAGVGLDVTAPEPLPDGHPLWSFNNVLITSHCADSLDLSAVNLAKRVGDNVSRFANDEPLIGTVDVTAGY